MSGSSIRFKRGNKADLPKSASSGTPLWCEDTKELYVGNGDGVSKVGAISNLVDNTSVLNLMGVNAGDETTLRQNNQISIKGSTINAANFNGLASKAISDRDGNNISSTYVKKNEYLGFNLFDTKTVGHKLTNEELIGWALSGSLVTDVYPTAVAKIKELYNKGTTNYFKEHFAMPSFTANTTNGITVSDSRGNTDIYNVVNGVSSKAVGLWSTYWFNINYNKLTFLRSYTLRADNAGNPEYPKAWVLKATVDGTNWDTINTQTAQTFSLNQTRTYSVNATKPYKQYRLVFSDGVHSSNNGEIGRITFDVDNVLWTYRKSTDNRCIADISVKDAIDAYYNKTGTSNQYILDSTKNKFYLPRINERKLIGVFEKNNQWCRIYSDGWCEQGGYVSGSSTYAITFLHPYTTTPKYILTTVVEKRSSSTSDYNWLSYPINRTPNGFTLCIADADSASYVVGQASWECKGYIFNPTSTYTYYCVGNSVVNPATVDVRNILNALEDNTKKMDAINNSFSSINKAIQSCMRMPNYSAAIGISIPYTAPSNGFVYGGVNGIDAGRYVYVNGKMVHGHCGYSGGKWVYSGSLFEVNKGDVVTCDYTSGNYYFYPMKG